MNEGGKCIKLAIKSTFGALKRTLTCFVSFKACYYIKTFRQRTCSPVRPGLAKTKKYMYYMEHVII